MSKIKVNEDLILYYNDGLLYRICKPLSYISITIYKNGVIRHTKNGEHHRNNDLPAVIYPDGRLCWYQNGKRHRDNGKPAIVCPTSKGEIFYEWWKHDKFIKTEGKKE